MFNEIKKSILSGILISIGGCVYMASVTAGLGWLGALLFTGGLFAICVYGFNLYTGKVGYIAYHFKDTKYISLVAIICLFIFDSDTTSLSTSTKAPTPLLASASAT